MCRVRHTTGADVQQQALVSSSPSSRAHTHTHSFVSTKHTLTAVSSGCRAVWLIWAERLKVMFLMAILLVFIGLWHLTQLFINVLCTTLFIG